MARQVQRKNYRIDVPMLRRAKKALKTTTETETIHRALQLVTDEIALAQALERLVRLGPTAIRPLDDAE